MKPLFFAPEARRTLAGGVNHRRREGKRFQPRQGRQTEAVGMLSDLPSGALSGRGHLTTTVPVVDTTG
ncbi:MAG: hypothetical protein ACREBD_02780 [Blastocatellia bacterium]